MRAKHQDNYWPSALVFLLVVALSGSVSVHAQDEIAEFSSRGEALFFERVSCWICHGEDAQGLIGPSLQHGPTPMDIQVQLDSNPQMAVIVTVLRPYWVAKVDPANWEVVAEYPYTGYRGDWVIIDSRSEYMYVPAAVSNNVTKVNLATGAIEWSTPTGIGPYGGTLNADETQVWISNKGETSGQFGRTITVIDMPHRGEPHGLVWVTYDENGEGRVVRDQGGFHNGVHPARGSPLILANN